MTQYKVLILINDIDPNIYLNGIDHKIFNCDIIYQKPTSKAMEKKFLLSQKKLNHLDWHRVPTKEDLIPKAKEISLRNQYDTIIAFAEDLIIPVEKLKKELNLSNQYDDIKNIQNKNYQRDKTYKQIPELSGEHLILSVNDKIDDMFFNFPVIVKPMNKSGSLFVNKINNLEKLNKFLIFLKENMEKDELIIIEDYFEGCNWYNEKYDSFFDDYISVESIVSKGQVHHICVSGKPKIAQPFRETGLVAPAPLNNEQKDVLFKAAEKVINTLDYNFGPTHIEFKLTKAGPKLIEFNPRSGGPVPFLIQTGSNFPVINNIIKSYLNLEINDTIIFDKVSAFFSFQVGKKDKIKITNINTTINFLNWENINEFFLFKGKGDIVYPLFGTSQMIGFSYISVNSFDECINLYKKIIKQLDIKYQNLMD